jgi:hypothetical protein
MAERAFGNRTLAWPPSPGQERRGTEGLVAGFVCMRRCYDEVTAMKVTSGEPPFQRSVAAVTRREKSVG